MAHFVFGGEPLNNGKSNFQVSPAPANQSINDTDWNLLYAHLSDTRGSISDNAYYFGMAQSSSAVSGANKARLRLNASNIPQMSVNGGIYRKLTPDYIHLDDYAVGDGTTNDYAAIVSALADAVTAKVPLVMGPKVYATASNIVMASRVTIIGTGYIDNNISTFKALAGCTRVVDLRFESRFYNLYIDGNRQADYGLYMQGASFCHFDNLHIKNTKKDGIRNPDRKDDMVTVAINDNNTFIKPQISNCGTVYGHQDFSNPADAVPETRTVGYYIAANQFTTVTNMVGSITSGDATLTVPLATFQTWGVRRGDPIRVGAGANVRYFTVASVTSETVLEISKTTGSDITITNERVAVAVGDGYNDERSGDNNINKFIGGLFRSNAGFAVAMDGLYGHNLTGVQIDYCPWWGIRVGSHGADPVISSTFVSCYIEACRIKPFFIVSASSIFIAGCLTDQDQDDAIEYNNIANAAGVHVGKYKINPVGNGVQNYIETRQTRDLVHYGYSTQGASVNYVEGAGWDGISTITASADVVDVNPAVSNPLTLNFATVIAMRSGQMILLRNVSETNTLILQDRRVAGTGLWLNNAITYMPPKSTITLFCDGARWIECAKGLVDTSVNPVLCGSGTTANRPSATYAGTGALYYNTDDLELQVVSAGAWVAAHGETITVNNSLIQSGGNAAMEVKGWAADGAGAIGVKFIAANALSTAGAVIANFYNAGTIKAGVSMMGAFNPDFTDDSGTTGNRTVDKPAGINAFAAAATSITITNSCCKATSIVKAHLQTNDATAWIMNVVPSAGSFTINLGAAATGTTKVAWEISNGN